jgi:hypothetical protein
MGLTPHDLRAIRHADHLVFRYNSPRSSGGQRGNWLECGLDARHSPTGFDQAHAVVLGEPRITVYDDRRGEPGDTSRSHPLDGVALEDAWGCVSVYPRYEPAHQTWIRTLRTGDELAVRFVIGNNNDYLRRAGLSFDEAWLVIRRPGAKHEARYYLDACISPVFSTCRMIQPNPSRQAASA